MKGYGTKVVAGVTPGRGGEEVAGIPVYNTVEEAVSAQGPVDASVTFVPGPALKGAVLEAMDSGIPFIVMPVERVPLYDILEMMAYAKLKGTRLLGPGAIGIISPQSELSALVLLLPAGSGVPPNSPKRFSYLDLLGLSPEAVDSLARSRGPLRKQDWVSVR
jgi:succinyl-CoA synthetase alpha subunit